jgi:hypothetical protein
MEPVKKAVGKTGEVLHKAVDATILDKSPHGTNVDGMPKMDGEFVKEMTVGPGVRTWWRR